MACVGDVVCDDQAVLGVAGSLHVAADASGGCFLG